MGRFSGVVFLDRDGTLIHHHPYLSDPGRVVLVPGAGEAVARLNEAGIAAVVVTNQSGLARGLVTEAQLSAIHDRLRGLLRAHGARLDGLYFCPHLPDAKVARYRLDCRCRKPGPGMVERAMRDLGLDGLPAWEGASRVEVAPSRPANPLFFQQAGKPAPRQSSAIATPAWVVGDDSRDLELAAAVGATGILVRTGLGAVTEHRLRQAGGWTGPVVDDVAAAVSRVLESFRG